MKIVVVCDRWRENEIPTDIKFDVIGREILQKIDGNTIKEKYKIKDEREIGNLLENRNKVI